MDRWIGILLIGSSLMILYVQKISDVVKVLSFQAFILASLAGMMWYKTGMYHLLVAALLTLAVKGIGVPWVLQFTLKKIGVIHEMDRFTGKYTSVLMGVILTVIAYLLTFRLNLPGTELGKPYVPISLALIFLGVFIMINHKKAMMQGIGLITIENGLFLIAQSISYGMPLLVELGIFFDLLVTAVVIGVLSVRIHSAFASLNTDHMRNLKG